MFIVRQMPMESNCWRISINLNSRTFLSKESKLFIFPIRVDEEIAAEINFPSMGEALKFYSENKKEIQMAHHRHPEFRFK